MAARNHGIATFCAIMGGALLPLPLFAQAAAESRPFAAPDVAASLPSGSASGIGQVTLALLLVLLAVFAVAFLVRRLRGFSRGSTPGIEVLAQVALGTRERAMIVKVGEARLLLGVAPGRVSMLHVLPEDLQLPGPDAVRAIDGAQRPTFASLLRKSLGR